KDVTEIDYEDKRREHGNAKSPPPPSAYDPPRKGDERKTGGQVVIEESPHEVVVEGEEDGAQGRHPKATVECAIDQRWRDDPKRDRDAQKKHGRGRDDQACR